MSSIPKASDASGQLSTYTSQDLIPEPKLTRLDRFGVMLIDKLGSMGFVILLLIWTVLWCGYNILASEVKSLHWKAFDPFPAFVAYLLLSVLIQMLLLPLILFKQNVQARHDDACAEFDYQTNLKAARKIVRVLEQLDRRNAVLTELVNHGEHSLDELPSITDNPN